MGIGIITSLKQIGPGLGLGLGLVLGYKWSNKSEISIGKQLAVAVYYAVTIEQLSLSSYHLSVILMYIY